MRRNAWFITHEQHEDPRIWKFARALAETDYDVTYFLPPLVVPNDLALCQLIGPKEERFPALFRSIGLGEIDQDILVSLIAIRRWLTSNPTNKLNYLDIKNTALLRDLPLRFETDNVALLGSGASAILFMNLGQHQVFGITLREGHLIKVHDDVDESDLLARTLLLSGSITASSELSSDVHRTLNDAVLQFNEYSQPVLRFSLPEGRRVQYRRTNNGEIYKQEVPSISADGLDKIMNRTFNFVEFKEHVYNYSKVLHYVRAHLENIPNDFWPHLVYIADLPTLPIGIMLKEITASKIVLDCHEWWREQEKIWNPFDYNKIKKIDELEHSLYKRCDLHITVGNHLAAAMSNEFQEQFSGLYTCIFTGEDSIGIEKKLERQILREKLGLPFDGQLLIFQGSLTSNRNLETLVRASKYLELNQFLVIVGDGHFKDELMKIAKNEGDLSKIIWAGWVTQEYLHDYTRCADLGIIPYVSLSAYYSLSMPNKLAEYHCSQLPFVASDDLIEIAEIVQRHDIGAAINMHDAKTLGETVSQLLQNKMLLNHWEESYRQFESPFSYDYFSRAALNIIKTLD